MEKQHPVLLRRIRVALGIFIGFLILSGLTAFPLQTEVATLVRLVGHLDSPTIRWLQQVNAGLQQTHSVYPFFGYGTDWLAFAHLVIAIFFIYVYRDPIRNRQMLDAGILTCALVVPTAFICGAIREIPLSWRLLDSLFGIFGCIPLLLCKKYIHAIETA